ncbi:MAG: thermonuclease family protein [Pseudomonadota bacterium]
MHAVSRFANQRAFAQCATALCALAIIYAFTPVTHHHVRLDGNDLRGIAHVLDGDTLTISGVRIRLAGIDAPELAQQCHRTNGHRLQAGRMARAALQRLVAGRQVRCHWHHRDQYDRVLATCWVGGRNINRTMVSDGTAWAFLTYTSRYAKEEQSARKSRLGVWSADCMRARRYRHQLAG